MDYRFEELGPERFQLFCQALLAKEFKDIQCFPIAQPDGGRDAVVFTMNSSTAVDRPFNVYQVKFVRRPLAEVDPHRWLLETLKDEAPKLQKLVPKGARAYYLLTNVPGTAHPGSGSIDRIDRLHSLALSIPAYCWWRDDLNRKLDSAFDLKWAYPELLNGRDVLRLLVEQGLGEHQSRRTSAIRAFVRAQLEADREVRFKQVELQNNLLDLFIDVPVDRHAVIGDRRSPAPSRHVPLEFLLGPQQRPEGAAAMFLTETFRALFPQVVLEGAPGQGKSTLAQFLCQVYRMRLLEDEEGLAQLPERHRPKASTLPFRVDLRDLATWLAREDPFSSEENAPPPAGWVKSLDSFLAAQVRHFSGGASFSVDDLHAVARLSAILLVLDGLDEVADIARRREVVNEVTLGVARLREICASLQVVITSRPAAFANSPGFHAKTFPHLRLTALTGDLILGYADRWTGARRLGSREASGVKRVLRQKLQQPHLMALAQNPMQLAILLGLIQKRGASLPDKRTALYDSYVGLFLDREAEKSEVVREHRDLLQDLHGHLAWVLHASTEKGRHRGSLNIKRLQTLLTAYLTSEGRDPSLVPQLFTGMVERVVFLVSRVEGTVEFEVQPLREYFAARYLYESAPYSPPGNEKRGAKPDRFDALARNFYWLNVTRFFAGCFSKGELSSLAERLQDLSEADGYRHTSHPSSLATMLLSDWVFAQNQKATKEVVGLVLAGLNARHVLSNRLGWRVGRSGEEPILLPDGCGRYELVREAFRILSTHPKADYVFELVQLLQENASQGELTELWRKQVRKATDTERVKWFRTGVYLGVLGRLDDADLDSLLERDPLNIQLLGPILDAGRSAYLERNERRTEVVFDAILDGTSRTVRGRGGLLARLAETISPVRYWPTFRWASPGPLLETLKRHSVATLAEAEEDADTEATTPRLEEIKAYLDRVDVELRRDVGEWVTDLDPWNTLVEGARSRWGDRWIFCELANIAANVRGAPASDNNISLFDDHVPLCLRFRYARARQRAANWWEAMATLIKSPEHAMAFALCFWTWAVPSVAARLINDVDVIMKGLSASQWRTVARALQTALAAGGARELTLANLGDLPRTLSERTVAALASRLKTADSEKLYAQYLSAYEGKDPVVLDVCVDAAFGLALREETPWAEALRVAERAYSAGATSGRQPVLFRSRDVAERTLPYEVAKQITSKPGQYPRDLVYMAAERCRLGVAEQVPALADVARQEKWFEEASGLDTL